MEIENLKFDENGFDPCYHSRCRDQDGFDARLYEPGGLDINPDEWKSLFF